MYQEIQFHPSYLVDTAGMLANNKVFFIATTDLFLLGVLNSPLLWWHNWRYLPHMKDEAWSPAGFKMEELPIPRPTDEQRAEVERLVGRLIDLAGGRTDGLRALIDWLLTEMGVGKVSQKLSNLVDLTADELIARGAEAPAEVAGALVRRPEAAAGGVRHLGRAAEGQGPRGRPTRAAGVGRGQRGLRVVTGRCQIDAGRGPAADADRPARGVLTRARPTG